MNSTKRITSAPVLAALALAALALGGCREPIVVYQAACPNMPAYSAENQKATAAELRQASRAGEFPHLREKTVDGGNTRSQLRGAGCKETGPPRPALTLPPIGPPIGPPPVPPPSPPPPPKT